MALNPAWRPASRRLRALAWAGLFIAVYAGVFVYPALRLIGLLMPAWRPGTLALLVVFVMPAACYLAYQANQNAFSRFCLRVAFNWMGAGFIALCLLAVAEPFVWTGLLPARTAGALVAGLALVLVVTGAVEAQRLPVARVQVVCDRVPGPMRLVQVSDVHIGSRLPGFLDRVVARVESLEADAVCITGDLIDMRGFAAEVLDPLARLSAPVLFAIGNHERYIRCDAVCDRLEALGVVVLRNRAALVGGVRFAGVDDMDSAAGVDAALAAMALDREVCNVLLYHRPDGLPAACRAGIDLLLCGHTHGGQIVPFNLLVRRHYPRILGLHTRGSTTMYVSSGTGTWGPALRLGTRNEITLIELLPRATRGPD